MVYKLPTRSRIEFVALKIGNINQMVDFYTKVVGLHLIKRNEDEAYLGISQRKIFLSLHKINHPSKNKNVANMRSFSLILPDKKSLRAILVHISNLGIKISKIKSNVYFDMFYLMDPEGNQVALGISKFHHALKNVKGAYLEAPSKDITLNNYLKGFKSKVNYLPPSTSFGWIRMSVVNLKRSVKFYHEQFGLDYQLNHDATQAILMTNNDHRQQLILDQVPALSSHYTNTLGLDYFDVKMFLPLEIARLARHLDRDKIICNYSQPNNFIFVSDPNGINIIFSLL